MTTPFTSVTLLHPTPQCLVGQSFFITATPVDGDGPYTYEWKKNGVPSGDVANTKTFPSLVVTDEGEWTCEVKDANGVSVTPAPVKLEVTPSTTPNPTPNPTTTPTPAKKDYTGWIVGGIFALLLCIIIGVVVAGYQYLTGTPAKEGVENEAIVLTTDDVINAVQGEELSGTLEGEGGDSPYTFNVTCDSCAFTANEDGTYSWTPKLTGTFTAQVLITDANGDFNTVDLSLKVAKADAPTADIKFKSDMTYTIVAGNNLNALVSSVSGGKGPYTFKKLTGPEWINVSEDGTITGFADYPGSATVTVVITDADGKIGNGRFNVEVQANTAPDGDGNGNGDGSAPDTGANVPAGDGKAIAEALLGYELPNTPAAYVAGGPGMPNDCAGLCYNYDVASVAYWYGPNKGEENINQSPEELGDGSKSPIDRMRDGDVTAVIWYNAVDATLELCPIGTLDGVSLKDLVREATGKEECTNALPVKAGWHVIQDNVGEVAGFTVQYLESGWTNDPSRIRAYEACWSPSGTTATYTCKSGDEILVPPSLDSMVKIYQTIDTLIFTTDDAGRVWACNGSLDGMTIEKCDYYPVESGTHTYVAPDGNRTASVFGWQKSK